MVVSVFIIGFERIVVTTDRQKCDFPDVTVSIYFFCISLFYMNLCLVGIYINCLVSLFCIVPFFDMGKKNSGKFVKHLRSVEFFLYKPVHWFSERISGLVSV